MRARAPHPAANLAVVVSGLLRASAACVPATLFGAQGLSAAEVALTTDIPAQPLSSALEAFADQTGLHLVYLSRIVRNQTSRAVSAGLRPQDALARLLQGTGLRFEALTAHSVRILEISPPEPSRSSAAESLAEVIVTANRREESLQDVPITVQVLTNATLSRLGVTTFEDFASYLPGITAHGVGPGQSYIYVRGLGTGDYPNQAAGSNGSFPNVAIYLDEQSAQLPGRNLDVYAADLERIEVLEGPQGTLFGAGAEAGVLRYITNKPKLDVSEGSVSAGYAVTAHGDPSSAVQAMINVPVIAERLAVRGVIYDERRGGYLDNIPATFARSNTDRSISYAGGSVPANSVGLNNAAEVGNHINPVTYQGLRVEALYQFSEGWHALLAQSYQNMNAQGVFTEMAADPAGNPQPDLTVQLFNPSYDKDRFENTALTIDGSAAGLEFLYAGAYLTRHIEQVQDYTAYAHSGFYVDYYQCVNPGPPAAAKCFTPSSTWRDVERNTHLTQELRVTTPDSARLRAVGGLFYENYRIYDQGDWFYLTAYPYFHPVGPPTGYFEVDGQQVCCTPNAVFVPDPPTLNNPNVRPLGDAYFNDITRGYAQKAAYTSLDFDLIPSMTLTVGTRYFDIHNTEAGAHAGSFGCALASDAPNPCVDHNVFTNLNAEGLARTYSGFRSRVNLSYPPNAQALFYYTWSQGFRPGGFNRSFGTPGGSPLSEGHAPYQALANKNGGWNAPLAYGPDTLINNELGWKTLWLDRRLQWNGALYREEWEHAQIGAFDSRVLGGATINGANYRVQGLETSLQTTPIDGLTLEAGAALNHSELVKEATFYWTSGKPIDFSSLGIQNPAGTLGSSLAGAPAFQGNAHARYEWSVDSYRAFVQIGAVHQSHSLSTTDQLSQDAQGKPIAYDLPAFTTYDAAIGAGTAAWWAQLYGENISDTRAQLFANDIEGYKAVTVNRPRTIGLRITYYFGR
jgi:outer membrane receptor protein involved in Fe transport